MLVYWHKKPYYLPNFATQTRVELPEKSPTEILGFWRGFLSRGGLEFGVDFIGGQRKMGGKLRAKAVPFLGSEFTPLSDFFFDCPPPPKRNIRAHPVIGQIPSVLAGPRVVASEALRHDGEIPEGPSTCQEP